MRSAHLTARSNTIGILFASHSCYLDDSNGAAVASRAAMEAMARHGFAVEVVCGVALDLGMEVDPVRWLADRGYDPEEVDEAPGPDEPAGTGVLRRRLHLSIAGVSITVHLGPSTKPHEPDDAEREGFLRLFEDALDRCRPDVVVGYGGGRINREVMAKAKARGIATVFALHNLAYKDAGPFADVDAVIVPSRFAADYYRESLGLPCTVLSNLVDRDRARAERTGLGYVTFVNPAHAKGVYPFARIADELARLRPDIPLLVVESRGTEATLAACGLDLRAHGTVNLMSNTPNPRDFWGVTRICLMPSLCLETQGLVAVEAMINGIPVVASDRGALPETLGEAGIVLPLPDRLTPATRLLPTSEEVAPWVDAIIRLWDDEEFAREHRRKALERARAWEPDVLELEYVRFFSELRPGGRRPSAPTPGRSKSVVLVPHLTGIDWECEEKLRRLEQAGVRVVRRGGSSAIDVARNAMISDALHDGFESMMFIDADLDFNPADALRLLARPEPVVCGIYPKKGQRGLTSHFADGIKEVLFGPDAAGLYPVKYAATGFLRVKSSILRRMIDELELPLCNTKWGRGVWPFFMPMIVPHDDGKLHYLGEDWAFSHRLGLIGATPLADTSIRLWHWGRYGFGWEDAGSDVRRYRSYNYRLGG